MLPLNAPEEIPVIVYPPLPSVKAVFVEFEESLIDTFAAGRARLVDASDTVPVRLPLVTKVT